MVTVCAIFIAAVVLVTVVFPVEERRRRALERYWSRPCMGFRWRRRFPAATKAQIREFLTLFVDAFLFDRGMRTRFSPDDRVMDVYRADNPPGSLFDSMELEALWCALEERYGTDVGAVWAENVTLGELFANAGPSAV